MSDSPTHSITMTPYEMALNTQTPTLAALFSIARNPFGTGGIRPSLIPHLSPLPLTFGTLLSFWSAERLDNRVSARVLSR